MARATSSLSDFFFVHFSWFGMFPFWTVSTEEIRARSSDHLWVIVYDIISFVLFFFSRVSVYIPKEATFPVSVYIAIVCASSSGSMSCGVWDEGELTFTAGEWEGGVGRRKTFCCPVALETKETIFEDELNSLFFHSLGRKRNKKPDN